MSFKCSVFGHAYGDSEIEREREEDGSEVVTTIRETQTCTRCGESRVVSENKEVTTLETAADIVAEDLEPGEGEDSTADEPPIASVEEVSESVADASEPVDDTEMIDDSEPVDEPPIRDAEAETTEAGVVEPDPVQETDPETDDGVILDDEQAADQQPEREPGEWPDEPAEGDDQWTPETEVDPTPEENREIEPVGSAVTVPDGEFHCPECEFTTSVEESSLRRGDFCPECHRGALEHVTE